MTEICNAMGIENAGAEGRLVLTQIPIAAPQQNEVLIKVAYAGLNRADLFQKQGTYSAPDGASPIPGLEVSGEIVAIGKGVTSYKVGDKVCALLEGGGYGEYCAAPSAQTLPIPKGFTLEEAAAIPEALFTVWLSLYEEGGLNEKESVLIHAGASSIGTMAIQIACALGSPVFATAGNDEKCNRCESLGAKRAINYKNEDFAAIIKEAGGVDVILDPIGGDYIDKNLRALKPGGRMVSISFLRGAKTEVNFAPFLMKNLTLKGTTLRSRSHAQKATMALKIKEKIYPHLAGGTIRPVIDSTFPLQEAEKAHQKMQQGLNIGKILLKVGAS